MNKHVRLAKEVKQLEGESFDENAELLYECVQNVAHQSGASIEELIALLVHYGGIKDGILAANETFAKMDTAP